MKDKKLIIGIIVIAALAAGFVLIMKSSGSKSKAALKPVTAGKVQKGKVPPPAVKTFSKDMGGLTVKVLGSKAKSIPVRVAAYKAADSNSSLFVVIFASDKMQELPPGAYDIVIDTTPTKIYKNIKISKGKETVENLGQVTGLLNVKAQNARKKDAFYPVRVTYPGTNMTIANTTASRPIEVVGGSYDVEIVSMPRQTRKGVNIEPGKETVIDLGCTTGMLTVKAVDVNNNGLRYGVSVIKPDNNEIIISDRTNRPIEVPQGTYKVGIASSPPQNKANVVIKSGEETSVEFKIETPVPAASAVPAKPKK